MRIAIDARTCLFVFTLLIVGMSTGCVNYRHYDPSPVGIFYPNGCVTVRGREPNAFLAKSDMYTICHPVRISEVAGATYPGVWQIPGEQEVALLEFSDASIYVWTSTLRDLGRVEYTGTETAFSRTTRNVVGFFWGIFNATRLIGLVIIFMALVALVGVLRLLC